MIRSVKEAATDLLINNLSKACDYLQNLGPGKGCDHNCNECAFTKANAALWKEANMISEGGA